MIDMKSSYQVEIEKAVEDAQVRARVARVLSIAAAVVVLFFALYFARGFFDGQ